MFNVRLAGDHLYGKWLFTWLSLVMSITVSYILLYLAVTDDVFTVSYFVLSFSHEMSLMRSGFELSQFLRNVLPTFVNIWAS